MAVCRASIFDSTSDRRACDNVSPRFDGRNIQLHGYSRHRGWRDRARRTHDYHDDNISRRFHISRILNPLGASFEHKAALINLESENVDND